MVEIEALYGDSREILPTLNNRFHLVVTSPPYNVQKEYEEPLSNMEYFTLLKEVYKKMYDVMFDRGRVCINIPFNMTNPDGEIFNPYEINFRALENAGFKYRETIIWDQINSDNDTAWGSWKSASAPWLRHKTEAILVCYKGEWKRGKIGEDDITRDEFLEYVIDIWQMPTARRNGHPSPYPLELPMRCIKLFSFIGDWILDPFLGGGTTLLAARKCGRNAIGVELHEDKYRKIIERNALIGVQDITEY